MGDRMNISSSNDMGSYINSTSSIITSGDGNNNSYDDDDIEISDTLSTNSTVSTVSNSGTTIKDEGNDMIDEDEIAPTQLIDDDDFGNQNDELSSTLVDDQFKDTVLNNFKSDINNNNSNTDVDDGCHFKQLVRLKSTLRDHEIVFKELFVEREIGKGFFGKVYKGSWRGKSVALKKITISKFRDRSEADLFSKELSIISKLCHPRCVMFIGACSDPSDRCIVMEYMGGGSLRRVLDEKAYTINSRLQLNIARDIADGMNYLHTNFHDPIIHRDLTSSNVLLDGDFTVAKINDFGLSKEMKSGPNEMTAAMGSLAWMAPESFRGEKYTEKVDVYSYAIILWELMTLKDPYCGMEPLKMAFLAAMEDYRPPLNQVPPSWKALIVRCWHPKPDQRPTFKEILQMIDQIDQSISYSSVFKLPTTLASSNTSFRSPQTNTNSLDLQGKSNSFISPSPPSSQKESSQPPAKSLEQLQHQQQTNHGYYASQSMSSMEYETTPTTLMKQRSSTIISGNQNNNVRQFTQQQSTSDISCLDYHQQKLFVGYRSSGFIKAFNVNNESLFKSLALQYQGMSVNQISVNILNNKSFLAAVGSGFISLWDLESSDDLIHPIKILNLSNSPTNNNNNSNSNSNNINKVAWNQQNLVTLSSADSCIKLWDLEKGCCISTMEAGSPQGTIDSLPYHPLIVSGGLDKKARLWDIRSSHCFRTFVEDNPIQCVKFRSPISDPILMIGTTNPIVRTWNMYTSHCLQQIDHIKPVLNIHSNVDCKEILSYSKDGTMIRYKYDDASQEQIRQIQKYPGQDDLSISSAQLVATNKIIYSQGNILNILST